MDTRDPRLNGMLGPTVKLDAKPPLELVARGPRWNWMLGGLIEMFDKVQRSEGSPLAGP